VVLDLDLVCTLDVLLSATTAISDFELLGVGRLLESADEVSSETDDSFEFRRTGQKMSEADLDGMRRTGACLLATESLEAFFAIGCEDRW
jgi:hypothetical protein